MTPTLEILKLVPEKIPVPKSGKECSEHPTYKDPLGYGYVQFRFNKKKYNISAHRAIYMLSHNIQLTKEDIVMHSCDNPSCINPLHLSVGTHNDNVQDRVKKNRSASGKNNGRYIHGKHCKTKANKNDNTRRSKENSQHI